MKRTTAAGSSGGAYVDYVAGVEPGTVLVAEDRNNLQEEVCHPIESAGFSLDGTDQYQLERSIIGLSRKIGELIYSDVPLTPVSVGNSRSTASPSNPEYNPIVRRHDADRDVTTTNVPQAVINVFRAVKLADYTATISGSTLTFAATTANDQFLAAFIEANLVNRWYSSGESATFAGSGAHYDHASRQYCINVSGTDYAVTNASLAGRTITVSGAPPTGSRTVSVYPFRIAGSTTSFRLRRLSGEVPVAAGDASGEVLIGLARMDRGQGHRHFSNFTTSAQAGTTRDIQGTTAGVVGDNGISYMVTDNTNGTPRTGKTTDPRAYGVGVYTHVRVLLQEV